MPQPLRARTLLERDTVLDIVTPCVFIAADGINLEVGGVHETQRLIEQLQWQLEWIALWKAGEFKTSP